MANSLHVSVSELVMGWKSDAPWPGFDTARMWWVKPGRPATCGGAPYAQIKRPTSTWRPTQCTSHAFEVATRMHALGFGFSLVMLDDGWCATFQHKERLCALSFKHTHVPYAICRAAVIAVTSHQTPVTA